MLGLEGMKKKYGDEEGERRYNEWKKNVSKASKGRNTLDMFQKKYGKKEGIKRHKQYIERSKKSSIRSIEYWRTVTSTEEEARRKHSEAQATFTKEKCIERYGEEEGIRVWKDRQKKWQETLNSKPQEEIDRINKLKSSSLENFQRKYGKEEGLKRWIKKNERISKGNRKVDIDSIEPYQRYITEVRKISERNISEYGLDDIEKRSREFHLDHRVSICYGFNHNISPEIIGSIHNLEIISASENCSKCVNNSIDPKELMEKCDE